MGYSTPEDLLLGDIPLPPNAAKYVNDASDEIDSKLGLRYVTPIVVTGDVAYRPTKLLLKRIANFLASGRLILALSISQEMQFQNAYARELVNGATAALDAIANGDITLPGAQFLEVADLGTSGPIINNLDAASNVESFYEFVTQDPLTYVPPGALIWPAGTTRRTPYTW